MSCSKASSSSSCCSLLSRAGRRRTCLSEWFHRPVGDASNAAGKTTTITAARIASKREDDGTFVLRSELADATLSTHVIEVRTAFKVLGPICRPGSATPLAADDRAGFLEYAQYLCARMNAATNCRAANFDNADFDQHRLFSVRRNRDPANAKDNQRTYLQLKSFVRPMNIVYVLDLDECEYRPDWDDFNSPLLDDSYKARLRNSLDPNYRDWVDPVVKGYQFDMETGTYRPTGLGAPVKNPDKLLCIWCCDYPGKSN
jgi:hypothetical protein